MFETIIQGQAAERAGRKRTVLVSFAIHVLVLGILIVIPLIYYQTIPGGWEILSDVFAAELPDPVPPAPPPQVRPASGQPRLRPTGPVVVITPLLIEPGKVPPPPDAIEIPLDKIESFIGPCCHEGQPFVPESALVGPMANLSSLAGPLTPPPPPPKPPKQPMLISTLDPSRLIYRVEPVYPQIAISARVQGSVLLQVTVSETGTVDAVEVMSGHPLLTKAAVEAVQQWRYKPTILNGEPVPVKATVTVNFNLRR